MAAPEQVRPPSVNAANVRDKLKEFKESGRSKTYTDSTANLFTKNTSIKGIDIRGELPPTDTEDFEKLNGAPDHARDLLPADADFELMFDHEPAE